MTPQQRQQRDTFFKAAGVCAFGALATVATFGTAGIASLVAGVFAFAAVVSGMAGLSVGNPTVLRRRGQYAHRRDQVHIIGHGRGVPSPHPHDSTHTVRVTREDDVPLSRREDRSAREEHGPSTRTTVASNFRRQVEAVKEAQMRQSQISSNDSQRARPATKDRHHHSAHPSRHH